MTTLRSLRRPRRVLVASLAAIALAVATAAPSAAGDTEAERDEVRDKAAEVATEVDTLNATSEEVSEALDALDAKLSAEEARLASAQRAADDAADALSAARVAEERAEAAVAAMQAQVEELAVNAFVSPPGGGFVETLQSDDLSEAVLKQTFIDVRAERDFDVLDQLEKAQNDLEVARGVAEDALAEANEALAEVDARFDQVAAARDAQATVVADVQSRLDQKLAEAAALEELDAELSKKLREEQAELARQLAAQQRALEQQRQQAQAPSAPVTPVQPVASGDLCSTHGFTVSCSIVGNLGSMLDAAAADGHTYGGGGYRSSQGQINTRRNNCGTSDYAIYQMPPSQCRPPTARPGTSMHEKGLALDFTYQGRLITSRSNPGFQWLAANAASYGFYNLPSEPWHWSTNGR